MNKLMIFFTALVFAACGTATSNEQKESGNEHEHGNSSTALQLNNGSKWKADSTTNANVAVLMQLANDGVYSDKKKSTGFYYSFAESIG